MKSEIPLLSRARGWIRAFATIALFAAYCGSAMAAERIEGRVNGSGKPIARATVTLWAAGEDAPRKLAETQTGTDGHFEMPLQGKSENEVLYLVARGGEPTAGPGKGANNAVALLTIVGTDPLPRVVINELTTAASAWTAAQFLNGDALRGHPLGLRIAAGNVPNLVDLETGGLGPVIQDPLNSSQTTTLAMFSTLGNLLAGCVTQVQADACAKLFAVTTPPNRPVFTDTLAAAQNIARMTSGGDVGAPEDRCRKVTLPGFGVGCG
jgi:hypothetical protein